MKKDRYTYQDLLKIMEILRSRRMSWDREQDHETLKRYLIEEAYEVLEAIDQKNRKNYVMSWVIFFSRWCFMLRLPRKMGSLIWMM